MLTRRKKKPIATGGNSSFMQVKRKAGRKASSVTIIGSRLVELLQERGMRQQDLADEITVGAFKGVSLSTINRAINNNRMDISVLHAVADYLNVSVDYLTNWNTVAINNAPTVEAIPIEYIKNQIDRWERSKCESYHAICYRHLIEEWKMENERKE